jgi:hypothetical protein
MVQSGNCNTNEQHALLTDGGLLVMTLEPNNNVILTPQCKTNGLRGVQYTIVVVLTTNTEFICWEQL